VPTYAYACTECDHRFEQHQAFSDPALNECPRCSGRLRKVFNSVGIVFKGSGFYRTDSRKDAKAGSSGAGPDTATTDKPAAKDKDASSSSGASSGTSGSSSSGSNGSGSNGSGSRSSGSTGSGSSSGSAAKTTAA
jgi:putative FmdB family regulatory protein